VQPHSTANPRDDAVMQILVIEDTLVLAQALAQGLQEDGHRVLHSATGANGLEQNSSTLMDLVILDLGLPDIDGMEVLARLRKASQLLPVIVLTARDAVESRVAALDAGADDYLVKPFAFAELLARVRAVGRRVAAPRVIPAAAQGLVFEDGVRVIVDGTVIELPPRQHAMLMHLAQSRGAVVTRDEILRTVFGYHFDPGTNLIDVHLAQLRKRLTGTRLVITTIRSVGFKLDIPT
jgi:two-component system, OmpR family, response regulator